MLHSGAVPFRRKSQSHYHDYRWEDAAEKHRSALRTGPIQASGLTEAASWDSSGSLGTTTTVRVSPSRIG